MLYYSLTSFCMLHLIVASALDCNNRTDCLCCIDQECETHPSYSWMKYYCPKGCIDGYRGGQCYLKCSESCKACAIDDKDKCTKCFDGYFLGSRKDCKGVCPTNCKTCTSISTCNECKKGFYNKGSFLDCRFLSCPINCICEEATCVSCRDGFYNTSILCESACPRNCASCSSGDVCTKCHDGYYSGYQFDQQNIDKSEACGHNCRKSCLSCISYNKCTQCNEGSHGPTCEKKCSIGCDTKNCSIATGECSCRESFTGTDCTSCTAGKYGLFCNMSCPSTCMNGLCDKYSGDCIFGCVSNNFTGKRCSECATGMFGNTCDEACSDNCMNITCERDSGKCLDGCKGNFSGSFCKDCVSGKFGPKCKSDCPERCLHGICQKDSGHCLTCDGNFAGAECNRCISGFYGISCNATCSKQCLNSTCDQITGNCNGGCKDNFSGDKCCIENGSCSKCDTNNKCRECKTGHFGQSCKKECPTGCASSCNISSGVCDLCKEDFFGSSCDSKCSDTCNKTTDVNSCDQSSGRCVDGCITGTFGDTCNKSCSGYCVNNQCERESGFCLYGCTGGYDASVCSTHLGKTLDKPDQVNVTGPVVGGVVGLIILTAGIIVTILFYKRRHMKNNEGRRQNAEIQKPETEEEHIYRNIADTTRGKVNEEKTSGNDASAVVDIIDVKIDKPADNLPLKVYDNIGQNNHRLKVEKLLTYVKKEVDSVESEFMKLTKGLTMTCNFARQPEYKGLNRYTEIYPYDHSRVTIPGQPTFFINASYIDGYNRRKAYIASLGPTAKTTDTFSTFWSMVWNEKSDIIVMLTNLRESSGMKCEQYWPKVETDTLYGQVKVKCRSVEEYAEYTVRTFTVSKGQEQRNLLQLHYTAWPDKSVPLEVTSLVEFRQRVKAVPVTFDGPIIVHCSAGVGRTGTYIALDQLTEEGKCEGSVDVFNCVNRMREQRVNMVQTAEQYIFLHKSLVHSLSFGCEALTAEQIQGIMYDTDDKMFAKLYQTLRLEVDIESKEEVNARQENRQKYKDKNRRQSDIPGDSSRVRLYLSRKDGQHDYINAVFINSFRIKNLFIAAQSPLSGTVEDFLSMIYQQNSTCVVALEEQHSQHNDVGQYLPADNETYTFGNFTILSSKGETKPQYVLKKLSIRNEKGEEKTVSHFQYKNWEKSKKVPNSAEEFVQFIKEIEGFIRRRMEDTPNIVVHCLNGYERSGLFCVVYKLLEKLEAERQVSVVNTVRKIRTHRKQSITSVEQLKFCYQCIAAYMEIYNIYSNFAT
ncbi:receptor-type tyrosine-protein phosphatase S-like [Mercenaria mercenaria]|uniref:receptor-type tyrosine-protein phosphatase S-like n=1 Tax=Mercenaria mercenaria TaxID=6596 RepID=UPI00234F58AF|nr:receptor-type tyrosine-protein phosphatase S-like [Mercenaria mercenaria]